MSTHVLTSTPKVLGGAEKIHSGKVRETYDLGDGRLLIVATDRISALDVVLPNGVPDKGRILTRMSAWWFEHMTDWGIPHHFIATVNPGNEVELLGGQIPQEYHSRSMVVLKAEPILCEAIVRGYITGSGWKDYLRNGQVSGNVLPEGMVESERFGLPIFTPSTKAPQGQHDENIGFDTLIKIAGQADARVMEHLSLSLYGRAQQVAEMRGIILADTKFEFGKYLGRLIMIDEVITPDSSRFWPLEGYMPGKSQPSFDKQPVRDWLSNARHSGLWDGTQEHVPEMPPELVDSTAYRYREIFRLLTGEELE